MARLLMFMNGDGHMVIANTPDDCAAVMQAKHLAEKRLPWTGRQDWKEIDPNSFETLLVDGEVTTMSVRDWCADKGRRYLCHQDDKRTP